MARAKEVKSLAEWREERGLTVQQLADAVGQSRGSMGRYIKGDMKPGIRLAYRIAGALGVEVTQIKDWQVERPVDPPPKRPPVAHASAQVLRKFLQFYVSLLSLPQVSWQMAAEEARPAPASPLPGALVWSCAK